MKVISSEENELKFDNGLVLTGDHSQDCCEYNYLDFEQLPVGTELPDMTAKEFYNAIVIKDDGFIVKDVVGIPKWVQARSNQNGYYSDGVDLIIEDSSDRIIPKRKEQNYGELFTGDVKDY